MRQVAFLVLSTIAVGTATFLVTRNLWPQQAVVVSMQPFTATVSVRTGSADGKVTEMSEMHGLRADGSTVQARTAVFADGKAYTIRVIKDVSAKRRITIDEATRSITTTPLGKETLSRMKSPATNCSAPGLTRANLHGFDVFARADEDEGCQGCGSGVQWEAPELNCFPIRRQRTNGKGWFYLREVTSVVRSEPAPSLFLIPEGYVERSPGQVFAEAERLVGRPLMSATATSDSLDNTYHRSRSKSR
jgi:hypothetical protein